MENPDKYADTDEAPPANPAATLVIFRHNTAGGAPQLLMVQRSAEMRFAGGAAVFPGGQFTALFIVRRAKGFGQLEIGRIDPAAGEYRCTARKPHLG